LACCPQRTWDNFCYFEEPVKRSGWYRLGFFAVGLGLLWAQRHSEVDSLEAVLQQRRLPDSTRLSVCASLARAYLSLDAGRSLLYARQMNSISQKLRDRRREVLGWYYQAAANYQLERYEEAERNLKQAEDAYQTIRPDTGILVQFKSLRASILEARKEEVGVILPLYQEALELARRVGQPRLIVMALNNLSGFYVNADLYELARPLLQEAITVAKKSAEIDHLYNAHVILANYHIRRGVIDSALAIQAQIRSLALEAGILGWVQESYGRSVAMVVEGGRVDVADTLIRAAEPTLARDSLLLAKFLNWTGTTFYQKGLLTQARAFLERALKIAQAAPYPGLAIKVLMNLASLHERQAQFPEAMDLLLKARTLCDKYRDTTLLPMVLLNIGNIYYAQEQYERALQAYSEAATYANLAQENDFPARVAANLAVTHAKLGNYDVARQLLQESSLLAESEEKWSAATTALVNLTWIDIERKAYEEALQDLRSAEKYAQKSKDPYLFAQIHLTRAHILYQKRAYAAATKEYEAARGLLEPLGAYQELEEVYQKLSELYAQQGQYAMAYQAAKQLAATIRRLSNEENARALTRLELSYQFEKEKERQDQLLREEQLRTEKARQVTYVIFISAILVIGAALFGVITLYRANRKEKEANIELARRNALIEEQKRLLEEKNDALERAKKDIEESIQYARRIQLAILPDLSQLYSRLRDTFVLYLPRDVVSGDFYYFYPLSEGMSLLAVADCTGHGVPGAFMSMIGSTLLNKLAQEEGLKDAAGFLDRLDEELRATLHHTIGEAQIKDGMDISLCLIDHYRQELQFAGAKRPLYLFRADGSFVEIKGSRRAIGGDNLADRIAFENHVIPLEVGMSFYLFSDGIVDQFGWEVTAEGQRRRTKFMTKRLRDLLSRIRHMPPDVQKEKIELAIADWRVELDQIDDICVIGVRYS